MVSGNSDIVRKTMLPYKYIIDTSSILTQKPNERYRRKVLPSLWENIDELIINGIIVSCKELKDELKDEIIIRWFESLNFVILKFDDKVQFNVTSIINKHPKLIKRRNPKSFADALLIATAMKYKLTVITEEGKNSSKKIPKICAGYKIPCINIIELAEAEKWRF
jgi:PIN domain nuclease of toxin-antitoxin system